MQTLGIPRYKKKKLLGYYLVNFWFGAQFILPEYGKHIPEYDLSDI